MHKPPLLDMLCVVYVVIKAASERYMQSSYLFKKGNFFILLNLMRTLSSARLTYDFIVFFNVFCVSPCMNC